MFYGDAKKSLDAASADDRLIAATPKEWAGGRETRPPARRIPKYSVNRLKSFGKDVYTGAGLARVPPKAGAT